MTSALPNGTESSSPGEPSGFAGDATMSTTTLWRATPSASPWFGRGSYWTHTPRFAAMFRCWLDETFPDHGPHEIYTADVDVGPVYSIPFGTWVPSPWITENLDEFSNRGYRWVTFYEGVHRGTVDLQWAYVGTEPIRARAAHEEPATGTR